MNLELSSEQELLRESAAGVLARLDLLEGARAALDSGEAPDQWDVAEQAGWPELVSFDEDDEMGVFDAMLVLEQCGAALASPGLLGHLPARALLAGTTEAEELADRYGRMAAAFAPVEDSGAWSSALRWDGSGAGVSLSGSVRWILDGARADTILIADGGRVVAVSTADAGVEVVDATNYDMTRALGHLRLDGVQGQVLDVAAPAVHHARYLQYALLAADGLGTATTAAAMATEYAKERYAFGRQIGSYQGVKHRLVEMVRLADITRSLMYRVAWADESAMAHEFAVAACAARSASIRACAYATDQNLYVHGGIGATWEHDGHLLFRRSQVSSRLLGGDAAARHVARLLISASPEPAVEAAAVAAPERV